MPDDKAAAAPGANGDGPVVGPVLLTLGLAVAVLYTPDAQLVPALQSYWLVIHVSVAFIAS